MKKIDMKPYSCKRGDTDLPYSIKESLAECLFAPQLKIRALDLIKRDDLARKILNPGCDAVLLEESEYQMVCDSINSIDSFGRDDVEFVKRVLDAPEVSVCEK